MSSTTPSGSTTSLANTLEPSVRPSTLTTIFSGRLATSARTLSSWMSTNATAAPFGVPSTNTGTSTSIFSPALTS